jgi:hypothetical protein
LGERFLATNIHKGGRKRVLADLTKGVELIYFGIARRTFVGRGRFQLARVGLEARSATNTRVDMS